MKKNTNDKEMVIRRGDCNNEWTLWTEITSFSMTSFT